MNTPVNFEIAKLLKEKGYDKPTFYYYENEKLTEPYLENGSSTDVEFRVDLSDLKEHFNKWSKRVSAPTIAEVVMWLYEKHGIWMWVEKYENESQFVPQIPKANLQKVLGFFNSPAEAYSEGITYTLENLIKEEV